MQMRRSDFGGNFLYSAQGRQKFVEAFPVFSRRHNRSLFVALILNSEKPLWLRRAIVNRLPELERNHRILCAMDYKKRNACMLEPNSSVQLTVNKELDARQKPENLACHNRSGRKRRLQNHCTDGQS